MNSRVVTGLRIELRRSVAPWAGAVVLTAALAFLLLVDGAWSRGTTAWTAQWTSLALWTRGLLFYLWPVAVGLGALQGLRDHRSKTADLLACTPRPAWHRAAALAGATAITLASAYALLILTGGVQVAAHTSFDHLGWLPISLVGALFLVAGAVFGMGTGRALPSVLTPPAVTMAAFVFAVLMNASVGHTTTVTATGAQLREPNQVSLLSPAVDEVAHSLVTLSTAVHVGQTLWALGLAATGFALLVAATRRARLIALSPALAGALLALLVLPSDPRDIYVVDQAAARLVCEGQVCVSRAEQARLAGLAGPGEEALRLLRAALAGGATVAVRENTAIVPDGSVPHWSRQRILVDFDDDDVAGARGKALTGVLISRALLPGCTPVGWASFDPRESAARTVATSWVLGTYTPGASGPADLNASVTTQARPLWKTLRALPRAEQLERVTAMRARALACGEGPSPYDVLRGGAR